MEKKNKKNNVFIQIVKDFCSNLKNYFGYITQVGFMELFLNFGFLVIFVLMATFVYIPVGIIEDLVRSFVVIYASFSETALLLFNWFFDLISAICAIILFMYLFNKRFEDIEAFKNQINNKEKDNVKKIENIADTFELPKIKDIKK